MTEVSNPGEHHRQAMLVSRRDDFVVAHRAARLDHRLDAGFGRGIDAVAEREEGVAGHHRARHRQAGFLGLEPGADMEAIKKAYRTLSMQYHPDKVSHLGEEFRAVAEEKMKEINQAYDYFKKTM